MLFKFFALSIFVGIAVAEPIKHSKTFHSNDELVYSEGPNYELMSLPESSLIFEIVNSLIGYKLSALSVAVTVIQWLVSNFFVILFGAVSVLGFCKTTGKCGLNYEEYIPVSHLRELVTPQNIETAQKFLITAVEKYAEKRSS